MTRAVRGVAASVGGRDSPACHAQRGEDMASDRTGGGGGRLARLRLALLLPDTPGSGARHRASSQLSLAGSSEADGAHTPALLAEVPLRLLHRPSSPEDVSLLRDRLLTALALPADGASGLAGGDDGGADDGATALSSPPTTPGGGDVTPHEAAEHVAWVHSLVEAARAHAAEVAVDAARQIAAATSGARAGGGSADAERGGALRSPVTASGRSLAALMPWAVSRILHPPPAAPGGAQAPHAPPAQPAATGGARAPSSPAPPAAATHETAPPGPVSPPPRFLEGQWTYDLNDLRLYMVRFGLEAAVPGNLKRRMALGRQNSSLRDAMSGGP